MYIQPNSQQNITHHAKNSRYCTKDVIPFIKPESGRLHVGGR